MLQEILYADDIVLIAESMAELQKKFYGWKSALESKGLKVNLMKTKIMVSKIGQVTARLCCKKDPCGLSGRKTMLNAVLCKSCGKWIHGRCAEIKRVANGLAIDFMCRKCKRSHKNVEYHKVKLHDVVETVTEYSYLGDGINSGGGCVAAVTSRTRMRWAKVRECKDLPCRKNFPLKIKGIVCKSCVRSAMLYGSETLCLGQNEIGILQRTERAMVRNMRGVKLMDNGSNADVGLE